MPELASSLGICSTTYATLKAGKLDRLAAVSGCRGSNPSAADSIFQAASLTKPVVAYAALKLVLEGRMDLNAPVSSYLPRGYTHFHSVLARQPGDRSDHVTAGLLSKIRLSSLLNHTAGLPNWAAAPMNLAFEPGERWQYSGEGYMLLQSVIESVAAQSFASFMDSQVFAPLGMRRSGMSWTSQYAEHAVKGASSFWSPPPARFDTPVAAASLYTTAEDYARFLSALWADERSMTLTTSAPVKVDRSLGIEWGLGWGLEPATRGVNLWQWGNNPGFRSFAMLAAGSGDGFVVFTNSDRGAAMAVPLAYEVLEMEHAAFRFFMVG